MPYRYPGPRNYMRSLYIDKGVYGALCAAAGSIRVKNRPNKNKLMAIGNKIMAIGKSAVSTGHSFHIVRWYSDNHVNAIEYFIADANKYFRAYADKAEEAIGLVEPVHRQPIVVSDRRLEGLENFLETGGV